MFAITIFGDSIVFGRGDNKDHGWVGRLAKYFEVKDYYNVVYNMGIPGDTSTNLLKRLDTEAKARIRYFRPEDKHILVVGIGINDSRITNNKQATTKKRFNSNISRLIKLAKKHTKHIAFIGLTPVDEKLTADYEGTSFTNGRISEFNNIIKTHCQKKNLLFIDVFKGLKKVNYKQLLDDGVHPNSKGYQKMFEIIKPKLVRRFGI